MLPEDLDKDGNGLDPYPAHLITDDQTVFMDEVDPSLYLKSVPNDRASDPSQIYSLNGVNIFIHDNILFKITNANEVVYTQKEESSQGSNQQQSQSKAYDAQSTFQTKSRAPISESGRSTMLDQSFNAKQGKISGT